MLKTSVVCLTQFQPPSASWGMNIEVLANEFKLFQLGQVELVERLHRVYVRQPVEVAAGGE